MSSDNLFPFQRPETETEESVRQRKEITERIYQAILPMLGPAQAQELLQVFNSHLGPGPKANLKPVIDQKCEVCQSPMKIEEHGDDRHFVTSCTSCGYMDVLEK